MQISTGLPRPRPLALCILKAQEVTTKGMYRLSHAIYYCSYPVPDSPPATKRDTTSKEKKSPAHQLEVPRMRSSPRVCTFITALVINI